MRADEDCLRACMHACVRGVAIGTDMVVVATA